MKWISRPSPSVLPAALLPVLLLGCHAYPNVFVDDLPPSSMVTTPSMKRARASGIAAALQTRGFEAMRVEAQDGTVVHGPLYMEDPTEMSGSDNGQFAQTAGDLIYYPYTMARFIVNLFLMPGSMVVDPPDTVICSDGVQRRSRVSWLPEPYDAERCTGAAEPIDVYEVWTAGDKAVADPTAPDAEPVAAPESAE